jgi:uncharacterized repeat protein (TIGR01451 family)
VLTLTGAPRNLRIGVVTKMIYLIYVRNIEPFDATNVTVTDTLPLGLQFTQSIPPPTTVSGNVVTYKFATIPGDTTKLIVMQATLLPTTFAGTVLTNTAVVTDEAGNFAQETFVGGVRSGPQPTSTVALDLTVTSVRQVLPDSALKYTITANNSGSADATGVVLTVDTPPQTEFVSALPGPSSVHTQDGQTTLTFNLQRVPGPGHVIVRLTQQVPPDVTPGTALRLTANVTSLEGSSDQVTKTVTVRASSLSTSMLRRYLQR